MTNCSLWAKFLTSDNGGALMHPWSADRSDISISNPSGLQSMKKKPSASLQRR
jgi:hypothetical protein